MNEEQQLIIDTAKRIFADQCDKTVVDAAECGPDGTSGQYPAALWKTLEETGLTSIGVEAEQGGSGGSFADALLVLREAGATAAPLPLAEHLVALQLLAASETNPPQGVMTVIGLEDGAVSGARFTEVADWLLVVDENQIALLDNKSLEWQLSGGLAGETTANLSALPEAVQWTQLHGAANLLLHLGARARVNMMSGAISEVLAMSVRYCSDREQFGRSLSKFQAIQHSLSVLAGESAACQRAADATLEANNPLDVAIGKARVGEAVTQVTEIAHQVHGAIGYTLEHGLNHRTRRLWQWRDEYGAERYWQIVLGQHFCGRGADNLWESVTQLG